MLNAQTPINVEVLLFLYGTGSDGIKPTLSSKVLADMF
jgi:hypothetical protein